MKCKSCGAKVSKTEEICPECGGLFSSRESTADMGECLKEFNCNDNIPIFGFTFIMAIAVLVIAVNDIRKAGAPAAESILFLISGIFLCVMSVYMCLIYHKSYICVCENGIYGVIPQKGKHFPTFFKLSYDEIEYVDMSIIRGGKGAKSYIVTILTKTEKEFRIGYLNQKNSKLLADMIYNKLNKEIS